MWGGLLRVGTFGDTDPMGDKAKALLGLLGAAALLTVGISFASAIITGLHPILRHGYLAAWAVGVLIIAGAVAGMVHERKSAKKN